MVMVRCWLGLLSSESLTGAGGSASEMAFSCDLQIATGCWGETSFPANVNLSTGCLSVLTTWLASSRVSASRENKVELNAFYNLTSEIIHCYYHHMLCFFIQFY